MPASHTASAATSRCVLPEDPADLAILLDTLRYRLRLWADVLEVTADELAQVDADADALRWAADAAERARADAFARDRFLHFLSGGQGPNGGLEPPPDRAPAPRPAGRDRLRPGVRPRLNALLARFCAHPAFTDEIARSLGLAPTPAPTYPAASGAATVGSASGTASNTATSMGLNA